MERTRFTSAQFGDGLRHGAFRAAVAAAVIAGFLGGAIVGDGAKISLSDNAAFAKGGNGGGKGGGRGGGNGHGGGNKGGHGKTADAGKAGRHGKEHGYGHKDGLGHGGGYKGGYGKTADAGKAGGHAKGHGHGHKDGLAHVDGNDHSQGHGRGHSKGHGHGHAREDGDDGRSDPPGAPSLGNGASENGISAAALGSLNAAHASATARENASPNSVVGKIAEFAEAAEAANITMESEAIDAAAEALAAKSNKSITPEVVNEVSRLADVEVSPDTADAIAARAAEIQAADSEEPSAQTLPGGS